MSSSDFEESDGFYASPVTKESWPHEDDRSGFLRASDIPKDVLLAFLNALGVTEKIDMIDRLKIDMKWCDGAS